MDTSIVSLFRRAAQNALAADFDGVEICANCSYLIDRQSPNSSNEAENSYNIELENKTQLLLTIIEEVASVWDENKVGIKLISDSFFLLAKASGLSSIFYHIINDLNFYNLAYLHLEKPVTNNLFQNEISLIWLKLIHSIYSGTLIIDCQHITQTERETICQDSTDLVSFNNLSKLSIF
ncbi:hypothetical protein [Hyella patelloides]|uniref:oxidoreductase n=1 Tax=Hyella patelloides TaxID=1982969 RepID=UPI0011A87FAB|nr:hypothetical protein [Hyella patelloides]